MATWEREVDCITTCAICLEEFVDPRALPCLHTFCFSCIEGYFKDRRPGSTAKCPMCRAEFAIPQNGLEHLKFNFSIQKLMDTKQFFATRPGPCEVCSTDDQFVAATVICVHCSQKLCERCGLSHKKVKGRPHDVRPLAAELKSKQDEAAVEDVQKLSITGKPYTVCYFCASRIPLLRPGLRRGFEQKKVSDFSSAQNCHRPSLRLFCSKSGRRRPGRNNGIWALQHNFCL